MTEIPSYDDVRTTARRWYFEEIRSLSEDFLKRATEGQFGTGARAHEKLDENVHETLDGHEFVIYTGQAWAVCFASDNEDAYEDDFGGQPPNIEVQALRAMYRDLMEHLHSNGINEVLEDHEEED